MNPIRSRFPFRSGSDVKAAGVSDVGGRMRRSIPRSGVRRSCVNAAAGGAAFAAFGQAVAFAGLAAGAIATTPVSAQTADRSVQPAPWRCSVRIPERPIMPCGADPIAGAPGFGGVADSWLRIGQPVADLRLAPRAPQPEPGVALAASALVPGAGQWLLGNDRWVPYIAVELWGWITFLNRRSDARSLARDYRDLAWFVARRVSVGDRRDTIFEYYETMTHFAASGTWDADPEAPGVQPEFDQTTFNGDLWALARSLYFPGGINYQPGTGPYQRALAYYLQNAIPPSFTWAWGDSFLEQQSFRELIRRSDEAYRTSTQILGLILANHVVSAVDALVIGRLQGGRSDSRLRIGSGFEPAAGRVARLRIQATWRW